MIVVLRMMCEGSEMDCLLVVVLWVVDLGVRFFGVWNLCLVELGLGFWEIDLSVLMKVFLMGCFELFFFVVCFWYFVKDFISD